MLIEEGVYEDIMTTGRNLATAVILLFFPLSTGLLAQALRENMLPPDIEAWLLSGHRFLIMFAVSLASVAEVVLSSRYHHSISWIDPPKGILGVAERIMTNMILGILFTPWIIESWFPNSTHNAVLAMSGLSGLVLPQVIGKLVDRVVMLVRSQVDSVPLPLKIQPPADTEDQPKVDQKPQV